MALPDNEHEAAEWVSVPPGHIVTVGPELNILLAPVPSVLSHPRQAAEASAVRGADGEWKFMREAVVEAERATVPVDATLPLKPGDAALAAAGIDAAPSGEPDAELLRLAELECCE
jgi:hypothetical protein